MANSLQQTYYIDDKMKMFCQVQETKYDVVLNDEDDNFMDAWLDSPSSDPRVRQLLIECVASVCSITLKNDFINVLNNVLQVVLNTVIPC